MMKMKIKLRIDRNAIKIRETSVVRTETRPFKHRNQRRLRDKERRLQERMIEEATNNGTD